MVSSQVVVVGSLNHDSRIEVVRRPNPGETVLAESQAWGHGGKGGNQAVAAARAGARVRMVGAIGDDDAGTAQLEELAAFGVDVSGVRRVLGRATGRATIVVTPDGENSIIVLPGANALVDPGTPDAYRDAAIVVVQTEIGVQPAERAAEAAIAAGARLVVNAAPVVPAPSPLYAHADPLIVNEHEAVEIAPDCQEASPKRMAELLRAASGARSVVITLGARGCVVAGDETAVVRTPPVDGVVDTTGAGDTFVGALAAGLANGATLREAAVRASQDAGRCVQWFGARPQPTT